MNRKLLIFLSIIIFVFGYSAYQAVKIESKLSTTSPFQESILIKSLPDVNFINTKTSKSFNTLKELKDEKVVVIHFWATWCLPCVKEFPEFVNFANKLKSDKKIKILAVSVDDKSVDVKKFFTQNSISKLDGLMLLEDNTGAHKLFGSYKLPETFIFTSGGVLVRKLSGAQKWEDPSFQNFILLL